MKCSTARGIHGLTNMTNPISSISINTYNKAVIHSLLMPAIHEGFLPYKLDDVISLISFTLQ